MDINALELTREECFFVVAIYYSSCGRIMRKIQMMPNNHSMRDKFIFHIGYKEARHE